MGKEKNYENKVKNYLKSIGAYFIKTHGDRFSKSGTPDIVACVNGHFVATEVKAEDGKPSELQLYHLEQIIKNAKGYGAFVIPTEGIKKIKKYINDKYPQYNYIPVIDYEKFVNFCENLLTSH